MIYNIKTIICNKEKIIKYHLYIHIYADDANDANLCSFLAKFWGRLMIGAGDA